MKNIARLLFLCLCFFAADARAQFQIDEMLTAGNPLIRSDFFQSMVRPYRDRTERFSSARVEALQMDIAVNDESDQLTLENWGDNRADIRPGSSRLKVEAGGLNGTTYSGVNKDEKYSGETAGVYARAGSFELEASHLKQEVSNYGSSAAPDVYKRNGGGAGISFGGEGARFGLHGNMNQGKQPSVNLKIPNASAGAAAAFRSGNYEFGFTVDMVGRGVEVTDGSMEAKRNGPMVGVQAMMKPVGGLKAALRGSLAKLSGETTKSGNKYSLEGDNKEVGGRIEWNIEAIPLTLAIGFEKLIMDPEYKEGNTYKRNLTENQLKSSAAAFHFFGGRFLLGVEAQQLKIDSDVYYNNIFHDHSHTKLVSMAAGTEIWLLPGFGLRGSFKRLDSQNMITRAETFYNTVAAGVGLKGESLSLDVSARKMTGDNNVPKQDEFTEAKAMLGYKF